MTSYISEMPLLQTSPLSESTLPFWKSLPTHSFLRDSNPTATGTPTPPLEQHEKFRWAGYIYSFNGGRESREWDEMEATWVEQPNINAINTIAMRHLPHGPFRVEFLAKGYFNQVFKLVDQTGQADFVFRISLPVEPFWKTASEVATIHYIGKKTTIPVPYVVAYDPTDENVLGFEWSIQKLMPGVTLESVWHSLDLEQKIKVQSEIGGYIKEIRSQQFRQIGSIYFQSDLQSKLSLSELEKSAPSSRNPPTPPTISSAFVQSSRNCPLSNTSTLLNSEKEILVDLYSRSLSQLLDTESHDHQIGPLVKVWRIMRNSGRLAFDRGPYNSTTEYFRGEISFAKTSLESFGLHESIEKEKTDLYVEACKKLESLLDLAPFSKVRAGDETFVLEHRDMSGTNILIDPSSLAITAVLDWDSISTAPRWNLAKFPMYMWDTSVDCKPKINELPWTNWPKEGVLKRVSGYYDTCLRHASTYAILTIAEDDMREFHYMIPWVCEHPQYVISCAETWRDKGWWSGGDSEE